MLIDKDSDNLILPSYKGPSLLDAVDSVKSQDLRYRTTTLSTSYVINGYAIGTPIRKIMEPCTSLERGSQGCTIARAGDNVAIALQENDANQVMSGGVLCHYYYLVSAVNDNNYV
ncbi:unnamed protein product [Brassica napus]|uniref:Uncharacterized protein n=2 Tax=Brassica TaxID=3705 RepID=M4EMC5_BRACM|nr:unnamed protein product [Brassica napus]